MGTTSLFDRFRKLVRELRTANGANVSVTFALATIPMFGLVGAAVDYSHANSVKAAMQAASDSTALMLSKVASGLNQTEMQTKANDYFKALFTRPEVTGLQITATYTTTGGNQVLLVATADIKTDFMGMLGVSQMKVSVNAKIKWGNSRLRVALVLDNTGSMADAGKIDALKTATNGLLDQLKAAAVNNGDVYVSIIPFVKDVNVGAGNYQATWIDWTAWDAAHGTCSGGGGGGGGNGNGNNGNGNGNGGGNGSNGNGNGNSNSGNGNNGNGNGNSGNGNNGNGNGGGGGCGAGSTPTNRNTWNGCVVDRGAPTAPSVLNTDTNVLAPNILQTDTLFAAEQYSSCPKAVMPLNYDWAGMKNLVAAMSPDGTTNQAIGLAHGWMSLVGGGPYPTPPVEDPNYKYSKVIILLTDGLNTQNRWYTDQSQIDTRQATTCANVKATGITLYTVQVNTGGDATSTMLKNCASSADKFFLLTGATQMVATFQQIGTNLANLRIAQ